MEQQIATNPRSKVQDTILANVSAGLDRDSVETVEWAAFDSLTQAIRNPSPLANWNEYNAAHEVAQ